MEEFNLEQARQNMIQQQIRPWDVLDQTVLDVLASTPRELFVPEPYQRLAFADLEVPLGHNQVMMPPKLEARMLQALDVTSDKKALEVGTGSGYVTACLARLAQHVDSVDLFEDFIAPARHKLHHIGIENVNLEVGDASEGWHPQRRYNVIAVTGSLPEYKPYFERGLAVGGRLFVIVGEHPVMEAILVKRLGESEFSRTKLFETCVPPLLNVEKAPQFTF